MKITFFGSSDFSVPSLRSIASDVTCVVTKKPKPRGRGYLLEGNEVAREAAEMGVPLLELGSFKDPEAVRIKEFPADLFVVASFGLIIPRWVLDIPALGPVNVHPSLLPKYRGASPIQWVLLCGETETGITLIRMNEKMDAGNILYQERMAIEEKDSCITLGKRLSERVSQVLPGFLKEAESHGLGQGLPQTESEATYTAIIEKGMGRIDWRKSAGEILRQIRAFVSWPTAHCLLDNRILKVYDGEAERGEPSFLSGTIFDVNKRGCFVATSHGVLVLKEVQLENRKRVGAYEFAMGYRGLKGRVLT
jgi:methionyl-tRNA formyltransferase